MDRQTIPPLREKECRKNKSPYQQFMESKGLKKAWEDLLQKRRSKPPQTNK